MITLDLGELEYFDGIKNEFIKEINGVVRFEYTLVAIYNWEGRWKKPFLKGELTPIEMIDFYKEMALDPIDERAITEEVMEILAKYIGDPRTATTFTSTEGDINGGRNMIRGKIHTAEELYAMMFMSSIPLEFQHHNFNRLLTVMRIISAKNAPPKKMAKADIQKQNADLNAQRKKMFNTKG